MKAQTDNPGRHLKNLFTQLCDGLYERETEVKLCVLAAIAGESVFLLGPPGTGKSLLARRVQFAFSGARSFDYLMGRFSTPEEIFGPVSIALLKNEDKYVRHTEGYLPDADIVFLDEIWKASPPIQNALLTALNERVFRNGDREIRLPLKLLIGASNERSGDEAAFWDRFLIRLRVGALKDSASFAAMLLDENDPYRDTVEPGLKISQEVWELWKTAVDSVALSPEVISTLSILRDNLAGTPGRPAVSDRRWKKIGRIIRAAAFCNGRAEAELLDCPVAVHCLWDQPEELALVKELLTSAASEALELSLAIDEQRVAMERFITKLRSAMRSPELETVREPLIVDDEYFVFERFPGYEKDSDFEFRLWKHDADALPPSAGISTDIFVYRSNNYVETIRKTVERGEADFTYVVERKTVGLRVAEVKKSGVRSRSLSTQERAVWQTEAATQRTALQTKASSIDSRLRKLNEDAATDLFCPPENATALAGTMIGALEKLSETAAAFEADLRGAGLQ